MLSNLKARELLTVNLPQGTMPGETSCSDVPCRRRTTSLHAALLARRQELVAGGPGWQSLLVGGFAGDVEGEADDHGVAGEVPVLLEFVLGRVIAVLVEGGESF